jgi:hypothetical protein
LGGGTADAFVSVVGITWSPSSLTPLSDVALVARVSQLAAHERHATADLVESLAELDARQLYLSAGFPSLFAYCTQVLHLSEHAAYGRIEAARCARKFPAVLERLADGSLTLTAISLLAPVLDAANVSGLLDAARHKSKREVEQLVAAERPQSAVAATVRKLPCPADAELVATVHEAGPATDARAVAAVPMPVRRAEVRPLAAEIYKVQFTLSRDGHDTLRRAQELLRHSLPSGDVAAIFERALTLLVAQLEKRKLAATDRPRASAAASIKLKGKPSRHIPAVIRREVSKRDAGQCAFVGTEGRCRERGFLEFHHCIPFADGGPTSVDNIQLRCRAHNQHEADLWLGIEKFRPPGAASG